jgi:hypothetical protein
MCDSAWAMCAVLHGIASVSNESEEPKVEGCGWRC